jgi:hypothetical protein
VGQRHRRFSRGEEGNRHAKIYVALAAKDKPLGPRACPSIKACERSCNGMLLRSGVTTRRCEAAEMRSATPAAQSRSGRGDA